MKSFIVLVLLSCFIATIFGADTACQVQRKQELAKGTIGNFVPMCNADGSYSQVQCRGSTGFCWCADKDGNQITKSVRGKPNC
ncbi:equistatin-like [Parasteatoda tepidariorum]|uniref:equistatin-like n=1 Tax=Parasteatoda tepidariorum TaxID=114398 RepID=UPI0039BCDF1B